MVKRTTKSALAGKLNKALQSHANDETNYGKQFIDLPPGISNGVAQLIDAKIGTYKPGTTYEGKEFLYLAGSVVAPKEFTYIPKVFQDGKVHLLPAQTLELSGQRTSLMIPLCETTSREKKVTTLGENVARALNELRKLEIDTSSVTSDKELVSLLEVAKEQTLYFRFGTSARDPNAQYPGERVWENWYGSKDMEDYEPHSEDDVIDDTEERVDDEPVENEEDGDEEEASSSEEDPEAEGFFEGDGTKGDEGDEEAQARLTEAAKGEDIDTNDYGTWQEVEDLLSGGETSDGSEDSEVEEEKAPPEKGDFFLYKPPRKRVAISCEVTAVFPSKKTCNLLSAEGKVSYKKVAWDKLIEEE